MPSGSNATNIPPPLPTPIYHITHIDNLASIIAGGHLLSDARRRAGQCSATRIGYEHIKDRRMRRLVPLAARQTLGSYVPFNFCPRSVMLHSIWKGHVGGYTDGQGKVVHLVSTAQDAASLGQPWAFTDRHADPVEADYFDDLANLDRLRWDIIGSNSWGGDERRPFKQAEFLVFDAFPWSAVSTIGVIDAQAAREAQAILASLPQPPAVRVQRDWYYP